MASPLDQLYKTKLQLLAVLSTVGGVGLLMLSRWSATNAALGWLDGVPLAELGSTLFGTGLLAIFFEYVDRKHGEQRAAQRVREAVRLEAPAIRDAVFDSFAFKASELDAIASTPTLDRIATNALGLRLHDQALAEDVYTDIRDQVIRTTERWHQVDIAVELAPWTGGPAAGRGSMFVATVRWEYRVVPASPTMRFACVSDAAEYRELLRDQATTSAWYYDPSAQVDAAAREAFELVAFTANGKSRPIRRSQRHGVQHYTVTLAPANMDGKSVTLAYTYRVLVQRHGHLLYLDLPRPTKGLHVAFDYAGAGIRRVNTLDFIASSEPARVEQAPSSVPARTVDIGFDGWIFPRSGVAFVWVLADELK